MITDYVLCDSKLRSLVAGLKSTFGDMSSREDFPYTSIVDTKDRLEETIENDSAWTIKTFC